MSFDCCSQKYPPPPQIKRLRLAKFATMFVGMKWKLCGCTRVRRTWSEWNFFFFKSRAPWSIVEVAWLHFCARETAKSRRDWLSLTPLRRCLIREVLNVKGIDRCKHSGFILGSSADKSAIRATAETPIDWVEICDMSAMTSMPLLAWKSTFRSRAVWD